MQISAAKEKERTQHHEGVMLDYDTAASFASALDIEHADHRQAVPDCAAPAGALTWRTAAERNKRLGAWRRAVLTRYGEQTRALRVAWVLEGLFNTKRGYAFPSNEYLADATGMSVSDVQKGLRALDGEAIIRVLKRSRTTTRAVWPKRMWSADDIAAVATSRHSHDVAIHNLRRLPPTSQLAYARTASAQRDLWNEAHGIAEKRSPKTAA
jgi:hypothetical protein